MQHDSATSRVEQARRNVDEFVARWEAFTGEWDAQHFACELCQMREGRAATLFCDTGKYLLGQYNDTFWVCDECLPDRSAPGFNKSLVFRRIERDQPHAWSGSVQNDHRNGLLASAPVPHESFRLPAGVDAERIDPDALTRLTQSWFQPHGPWAAFVGINIASAPSLRAWLPLCGHVVLGPGGNGRDDDGSDGETDKDIVLVPLVCCDATSDSWGIMVIVEFFMYGSMSRWTRIADSLDVLARESQGDPVKRFWHARITGAGNGEATPPRKPAPFNQTNLASIITGTDMFAAITGAPPRPGYPY